MANSRQRDALLKFFGRVWGRAIPSGVAQFLVTQFLVAQFLVAQFLAGWLAAGAAAAAGAGGGAGFAGLIQHACTRPFRVSAAFGSMLLPCRIRQRNEAWIWALGQPKRS